MDYSKLASPDSIKKTVDSLNSKGIKTFLLDNKNEALEKIKTIIPQEASVMNGASVTLDQIGFTDYLKSREHPWKNLHQGVLEEKDSQKQNQKRKEATISDYYLGSVHALTEEGDFVIASNTGSQLPSIVFNSSNLIFVISTKKIVSDLDDAMNRIKEYIIPLEDKRMMDTYGIGTALNKILIFKNENPMSNRNIFIILVKEDLGF